MKHAPVTVLLAFAMAIANVTASDGGGAEGSCSASAVPPTSEVIVSGFITAEQLVNTRVTEGETIRFTVAIASPSIKPSPPTPSTPPALLTTHRVVLNPRQARFGRHETLATLSLWRVRELLTEPPIPFWCFLGPEGILQVIFTDVDALTTKTLSRPFGPTLLPRDTPQGSTYFRTARVRGKVELMEMGSGAP